jgi:hypothetical protein
MGAKKTGGTAGRQRAKDSAMAAALKEAGIERNIARCPCCHKTISVHSLYNHIISCKG